MLIKTFHTVAALALTLAFTIVCLGQQQSSSQSKPPDYVETKDFKGKVFEIKHRRPQDIIRALSPLGSGFKGATVTYNDETQTISVRDFPENIAAIEEALKRLDTPDKSPVSLEFQLHLIAASMTPSEKAPLPKNLEPVVEQLKSTLKFTNYRYISSALNRVRNGGRLDSSGVTGSLFPTPAGVANSPDNPSFYKYSFLRMSLTQDAAGMESIQIDTFYINVSVPVRIGTNNTQYRDIGVSTPISLREGEMAVVGTANIGGSDEAIIVVISVKKAK